jgi:hypothetical protein
VVGFRKETEARRGAIARSRIEELAHLSATKIYLDIPREITIERTSPFGGVFSMGGY